MNNTIQFIRRHYKTCTCSLVLLVTLTGYHLVDMHYAKGHEVRVLQSQVRLLEDKIRELDQRRDSL